jgi:single-strand DNA-binding protein
MYALNRVKLIGYVMENPEVRSLPNGTEVCDINLKVISKVKKDNSFFDTTSFHTVTCWRNLASIVGQYAKEGSQVFVEGRLKTDTWDGEDGKKRYKTKIVADNLILLTPKNGGFPAIQSKTFSTGINEVELIGNLTKSIEVRQTPAGHSVGNTSLATNRKWKNLNTNEFQEETEFHNIVLWNELAVNGEKELIKGRKIYLKGRMQTRSWDSPEGEKRYTTEVIAESISLLGNEAPLSTMNNNESYATSTTSLNDKKNNDLNTENNIPDIPSINYESDIKPEDLPF